MHLVHAGAGKSIRNVADDKVKKEGVRVKRNRYVKRKKKREREIGELV